MSDNERFTLYKYYECLVNKLIKIRGSRKYLSDSLEEKYATSINRLIDSFDFFEDQKKLEEEYSILINNLKIKFKEYANEIFANNKITTEINLNFDINLDTFL